MPSKHGLETGVLILYGHGSYGMSLSMGSGKLMAQVMQAMQVDIDTYYKLHFGLGCCGPERSFLCSTSSVIFLPTEILK